MADTEAICRISVQSHMRRVDVSVPADMPLAALLPEVVEIVEPAGVASGWQLSPIGRAPLGLRQSLRGSGIGDGTTLLLTPVEVSLPPPRFDDVTDAVSAAADGRPRWTTAARRTAGSATALWSSLFGALALVHGSLAGSHLPPMAAPALAAAIALAVSGAARRLYDHRAAATGLAGCGVVFAAAAGYLAVPGLAALPKAALAAAVGTTVAVAALHVVGAGIAVFTAAGTAGALITAVLAATLAVPLPMTTAGCVLITAGMGSLLIAPRLAIVANRIPLPDRQAAQPPPDLADRTGRAAATLTGLVCGSAAAAVVGSALAAAQVGGMALAAVAGTALLLRARCHVDLVQVAALIVSGTMCLTAAVLRAQLGWPDANTWFFAGAACAASAAFALGWGPMSPAPLLRRGVDIVEWVVLAAVIPVACWACDVYGSVRGMRLS